MVVTGGTPFWWYLIPVVWAIDVTARIAYWARAGADCVRGYLGETGIRILTRVMGLMLTAIALQFMINGWRTLGWSNQFTDHAPSVTMTCYATT